MLGLLRARASALLPLKSPAEPKAPLRVVHDLRMKALVRAFRLRPLRVLRLRPLLAIGQPAHVFGRCFTGDSVSSEVGSRGYETVLLDVARDAPARRAGTVSQHTRHGSSGSLLVAFTAAETSMSAVEAIVLAGLRSINSGF